jgi:hypothetical protein
VNMSIVQPRFPANQRLQTRESKHFWIFQLDLVRQGPWLWACRSFDQSCAIDQGLSRLKVVGSFLVLRIPSAPP